jgi:hypothetical protein
MSPGQWKAIWTLRTLRREVFGISSISTPTCKWESCCTWMAIMHELGRVEWEQFGGSPPRDPNFSANPEAHINSFLKCSKHLIDCRLHQLSTFRERFIAWCNNRVHHPTSTELRVTFFSEYPTQHKAIALSYLTFVKTATFFQPNVQRHKTRPSQSLK